MDSRKLNKHLEILQPKKYLEHYQYSIITAYVKYAVSLVLFGVK